MLMTKTNQEHLTHTVSWWSHASLMVVSWQPHGGSLMLVAHGSFAAFKLPHGRSPMGKHVLWRIPRILCRIVAARLTVSWQPGGQTDSSLMAA